VGGGVKDDPPSDAELAFLELQRRPRAYAAWAQQVRAEWRSKRPKENDHGTR
jgi:hypothetical protein